MDIRKRAAEAEAATARAMDEVAGGEGFGRLLARTAENAAAMMALWADAGDAVVRTLRMAGRQDVARLGARIAQTDDKLERVLQEIYALQDELAPAPHRPANGHRAGRPRPSATAKEG